MSRKKNTERKIILLGRVNTINPQINPNKILSTNKECFKYFVFLSRNRNILKRKNEYTCDISASMHVA